MARQLNRPQISGFKKLFPPANNRLAKDHCNYFYAMLKRGEIVRIIASIVALFYPARYQLDPGGFRIQRTDPKPAQGGAG